MAQPALTLRRERRRTYLQIWAAGIAVSFLFGWFAEGWPGIVIRCLVLTVVEAPLFAVWEWVARRQERAPRQ